MATAVFIEIYLDVSRGFAVEVVNRDQSWGTRRYFETYREVEFFVCGMRNGGMVFDSVIDYSQPSNANERSALELGRSIACGNEPILFATDIRRVETSRSA